MSAYLLTWNPANYVWESFEECLEQSANGEIVEFDWSCGNRKTL